MVKKIILQKEIAFKDNIVAVEDLPLPIVYYPGFYGTFFGFKEDLQSEMHLCSCSLVALENYIKFRKSDDVVRNNRPDRMFLLDSGNFPKELIDNLMDILPLDYKGNIIKFIKFKDKICHECNKATPHLRYCHEMYGGAFKQNYGWYIRKQAFEFGIQPIWGRIMREICPEDVLNLLELPINRNNKEYITTPLINFSSGKNFELIKIKRQKRLIWNLIENEVRRKFGHKNVGEAWVSETILYYIIKKLFPNYKIIRHYRPDYLNGLEFDIYIEEIQIGIEYQGIQHYKAIKHWGGKEGLEKVMKRDAKKILICKKLNIPLIFFYYNESLTEELVYSRLSNYLS